MIIRGNTWKVGLGGTPVLPPTWECSKLVTVFSFSAFETPYFSSSHLSLSQFIKTNTTYAWYLYSENSECFGRGKKICWNVLIISVLKSKGLIHKAIAQLLRQKRSTKCGKRTASCPHRGCGRKWAKAQGVCTERTHYVQSDMPHANSGRSTKTWDLNTFLKHLPWHEFRRTTMRIFDANRNKAEVQHLWRGQVTRVRLMLLTTPISYVWAFSRLNSNSM